jgi:hypothetical protein
MKRPRIYVDFNEMLDRDLVLLSKTDVKNDSAGQPVTLVEGLRVYIYMEDLDDEGRVDNLIAEGVVERNTSDATWGRAARWCCRIDARGIRHESDEEESREST